MLRLCIPKGEIFDPVQERFVINNKDREYDLEHSLISISRWESKWKQPFLGAMDKTADQTLDYISCMSIRGPIPPDVLLLIPEKELYRVGEYINDPRSATTITERGPQHKSSKNALTSEVIYSYMVALSIPWECERWHLNRLLKLIRVCEIHQTPQQNMPRSQVLAQQRALNKSRRAQLGSRG